MTTREQATPIAGYPQGKHYSDAEQVQIKVEQDIASLCERIASMRCQPRPNKLLIDTYETMLCNRIAVLKWLQHGHNELPAVSVGRSA